MTFRVGQKVVCVNGVFDRTWDVVPNRPVAKQVYTVRALAVCTFGIHVDTPCILLHEVRNSIDLWEIGGAFESPFWIGRFRPVVERKTDISIFTKMLTPHGVDA